MKKLILFCVILIIMMACGRTNIICDNKMADIEDGSKFQILGLHDPGCGYDYIYIIYIHPHPDYYLLTDKHYNWPSEMFGYYDLKTEKILEK